MKSIKTLTFLAATCICVSLQAQGNSQSGSVYDTVIDQCSAVMMLSSKTSGDAQQVLAMANNGNTKQLEARMDEINGGLKKISGTVNALLRGPFISRGISAEVRRLVDITQNSITNWNGGSGENSIADTAAELRMGLRPIRNIAQEIRQEVTSIKNDD